ncbi:ras-related protein RABF2b [Sitophilus oryzae]|uniref:Ras-related protein RABF2b n=1 Tax=Sitophilus oryzae TaxID=7048 RepID=A0A6J2YAI9_SITOR|nr:ras-related protein RABF2b [Sitophilus oryzae]
MKPIVAKLVVLGLWGVGKSSTVIRYAERTFKKVTPTVGASFFSCKLTIGNIPVLLQVWDTAGEERFKAMAPMFYRNANAALLVFDITNYASFESIKGWVQELRKNILEPMILCVVGNKIDLSSKRKVSRDEALQYANSIGALYHESSAKTDQGVGLIFESIARELIKVSGKIANDDSNFEDDDNMMAKSSELEATETAVEETVNLSINSIAHGRSVQNRCC